MTAFSLAFAHHTEIPEQHAVKNDFMPFMLISLTLFFHYFYFHCPLYVFWGVSHFMPKCCADIKKGQKKTKQKQHIRLKFNVPSGIKDVTCLFPCVLSGKLLTVGDLTSTCWPQTVTCASLYLFNVRALSASVCPSVCSPSAQSALLLTALDSSAAHIESTTLSFSAGWSFFLLASQCVEPSMPLSVQTWARLKSAPLYRRHLHHLLLCFLNFNWFNEYTRQLCFFVFIGFILQQYKTIRFHLHNSW